jgi:outer membrane protein
MKIKLIIASILLLGTIHANGQQGLKFGHVDTQDVFQSLPEMATVEKTIEEEYKKQEAQLTSLQEQLKAKQDDYVKVAKNLAPDVRAQREAELQQFNQRIQSFYTLAQQQLQAKQQELQAPLVKKVEAAIIAVGDEQGFMYIFEKEAGLTVYLSAKSIDATPLVKTKLGIVAK